MTKKLKPYINLISDQGAVRVESMQTVGETLQIKISIDVCDASSDVWSEK